ncbi:MAG: 5'-nucleotidase C-terminal domain-containing protein [Prevotellaceae bacterium]|jgi:2',3'-cyclic-nucleotide 2'-phosphodiesterase (5'-nucleotidase family)|nr:5'-nucleotidase C-terminal domain-containing protein [Prevotellaceae bacterium]
MYIVLFKKTGRALLLATVALCACSAPAPLITTSLQPIDSRFDTAPDSATQAIVGRYKPLLDVRMGVVVGRTSQALPDGGFDSPIARFTTYAILRYAEEAGIPVDFSLYNVGGLRTGLPKGELRLFDLYTVYSFDNNVVVLTIQGKYLRELAAFFARTHPQPMGNAALEIAPNCAPSLRINGEELDDGRMYRLITNNFVGSGGDGMTMLREAVAVEYPGILFRDAIIHYIQTAGREIAPPQEERK